MLLLTPMSEPLSLLPVTRSWIVLKVMAGELSSLATSTHERGAVRRRFSVTSCFARKKTTLDARSENHLKDTICVPSYRSPPSVPLLSLVSTSRISLTTSTPTPPPPLSCVMLKFWISTFLMRANVITWLLLRRSIGLSPNVLFTTSLLLWSTSDVLTSFRSIVSVVKWKNARVSYTMSCGWTSISIS